jgi:hypothetical protein
MNKSLSISFSVFLLTLLLGCSSLESKRTIVTTPSISANHPTYKTITINKSIDQVKGRIIVVANEEDLGNIKTYGNAIMVNGRRAIINENGLINYIGMTTSTAVGIMTATIGVMALGFGVAIPQVIVGLAPPLITSGLVYESSDNKSMRSVKGIAKLSSVGNGEFTEVKLNFNRIYYKKKISFNPFSDDEYAIDKVESIDDPKIYEFAFKRLQGIKAELKN